MDKIYTHKIIRFDSPTEYPFDIDGDTAEKLRKNFENEITAMNIIQSGDITKLEEFFRNNDTEIILGYSNIELGNERAFAERTLALSSIAAINGGVDCTVIYSMIYEFQNIIESTQDSVQLITLAHEILQKFCRIVAFQYYKKCDSPVLLPVLRYIHGNLTTKITVKDVAAKLNMNVNYLSRLFKQEIGETFSSYVLQTKITFAKHLMETTNKTVTDISEYLAFSSQSHFINAFKKITDTTPKQYLLKVKRI